MHILSLSCDKPIKYIFKISPLCLSLLVFCCLEASKSYKYIIMPFRSFSPKKKKQAHKEKLECNMDVLMLSPSSSLPLAPCINN